MDRPLFLFHGAPLFNDNFIAGCASERSDYNRIKCWQIVLQTKVTDDTKLAPERMPCPSVISHSYR